MLRYNKVIFFILLFIPLMIFPQEIDLSKEYSMDEFQNGVRAFHNAEYERAITFFIKSLGFDPDNHLARYFLGDSYRKAGYENNAIFVWNNLLSLGYTELSLRNKVSYLYNKKGMLSEININKNFLLREDIKGYYEGSSSPLFLKPSQIFVDNNNHYFIASFMTGTVLELDPNLDVVKNHFPLPTKFKKPFGVVVNREDDLFVSDFENDQVIKFDKMGIVKAKIGFKGIGEGALLGPEYLLLDNEENLYVADSGNHRVNKYNNKGEILFAIGSGSDGNVEGKLKKPAGMYYFKDKVYVCDRELGKVFVYDKSGNYLYSFGEGVLEKPYDITRDNYNRFLIICEKKIWAYEEENDLWYIEDAVGNRLSRGTSITMDKENNLFATDFNTSRLLVFSHERERYTNLNLNIERVFSQKFSDVHVALTVEKDDFSVPAGINTSNVTIYENGKIVPIVGDVFTKDRDEITDIAIVFDNNYNMQKYKKDLRVIMDNWLKNIGDNTNVAFFAMKGEDTVLLNDFGSTRLSILDSIDTAGFTSSTDKGASIKFSINHMLRRFSKKAVIFVTNSIETGNDFEKFQVDNCIALATNNNIPIYVVSFGENSLSEINEYIAKKTDGDYYKVYKRGDLKDLMKRIEDSKGREIIFSYSSRAVSRFGDEPITVMVEINYGGMSGVAKSIYYPARQRIVF